MPADSIDAFDEPIRATAAQLMAANGRYVDTFDAEGMDVRPQRKIAVVACMDSRMDIFALLGLENGDAHIFRNAGGVVTDDAIRSLCLSQRALGTTEIVLVHHTKCGVHGLDEGAFRRELEEQTGVKPTWSVESFDDPFDDVRQSIQRLRSNPFLLHIDAIAGFVYDVDTGHIIPVDVNEPDEG